MTPRTIDTLRKTTGFQGYHTQENRYVLLLYIDNKVVRNELCIYKQRTGISFY